MSVRLGSATAGGGLVTVSRDRPSALTPQATAVMSILLCWPGGQVASVSASRVPPHRPDRMTTGSEETDRARPAHRLVAARHRELVQDVPDVGPDGVDRDEHRRADLRGAQHL